MIPGFGRTGFGHSNLPLTLDLESNPRGFLMRSQKRWMRISVASQRGEVTLGLEVFENFVGIQFKPQK